MPCGQALAMGWVMDVFRVAICDDNDLDAGKLSMALQQLLKKKSPKTTQKL